MRRLFAASRQMFICAWTDTSFMQLKRRVFDQITLFIAETIAIVALAELGVMCLLHYVVVSVNPIVEALVDTGLLTLIVSPLIVWRARVAFSRTAVSDSEACASEISTLRIQRRRSAIVAGGAGLVGLVVTGLAVLAALHEVHDEARARFDQLSERLVHEAQRRVEQARFGLQGGRGVFAASKSVERDEFRRYVESRDLPGDFPGVLGFGFIERVQRADLDAFVARERLDDAPDFSVWSLAEQGSPMADLPDLFVIKYCFPADRNARAWGLDIGSEKNRREAAEAAIATGLPSITAKIELVQNDANEVSFLYFVPVFRNGTHPTTAEERRQNLVGLCYAPITLSDALDDVVETVNGELDFEIFDGDNPEKSAQLYDYDRHLEHVRGDITAEHFKDRMFECATQVTFGGRTWTFTTSTTPAFEASIDYSTPIALAIGGVLLSLVASTLVYSLATSRASALALAQSMTSDLSRAKSQAEDALREVAAFRTTLDQHSIISIADQSGRIIDVNERFCEISGFTRAELLGQDHRILNSGNHPKAFWVDVWRTITAGKPWRGEVCNRGKRGELYWVDSIIAPFMGKNGKVEKYVSIRTDITTRVLARMQLERQQALLREMEAVANVGGWQYDRGADFVHWTDQTCRIHEVPDGYLPSLEEAVAFYAPEARAAIAEAVRNGIEQGEPWDLELPLITAKGRRIWVRAAGRAQSVDGKVSRLYGAFQDITAQVAARDAARAQAELIDLNVRCANLGTWNWNISDGLVEFNDIAQTMLGYEPGEWEPHVRAWESLVHPDDLADVTRTLSDHLEGRTSEYRCEHRLRRKDGTWAWVLDTGRVTERDPDGKALRALGVHVDVDAARRAAEALKSAEAHAVAASQAKSEFLANMSHEIRTPMTAILGYADLLTDSSLTPDDRTSHLDTIRRNGEHLLGIINDILDISKIEAGKMTVERIPLDPRRILLDVESLMRVKASAKGISLSIVQETPLPSSIQSDPIRLRQILVNLVGNAIKFTENGGVTLRAALDSANPARPLLNLTIEDTGIGLTSEQISRLFGAFQQADTSTTRKFGGTGLGLRICKTLAHLLDGDVSVSSQFGKGSTFKVSIATGSLDGVRLFGPAELRLDLTAPPKVSFETGPLLAGKRIFYAEDGPDNQRLISFHLRKAGAIVTVFENGRLALDALVDPATNLPLDPPPCDMLLTDMQMPEMDGYALAHTLRSLACPIPIVALTAHAMGGDAMKCIEAGCHAYVTKPIDKAALIRTCIQVLQVSPSVAA